MKFSETLDSYFTLSKRFEKTPSFIEKISGNIDNEYIGLGTQTGEFIVADCISVRKYFTKNKNDLQFRVPITINMKQNTIQTIDTKEKSYKQDNDYYGNNEFDKGFQKKNVLRALCMGGKKICNTNFGVIGTVEGFVTLVSINDHK